MIKKFLAIGLLFAVSVFSASVDLSWDPSPSSGVAGYALYYGTASGNYTTRIDVGSFLLTSVSPLSPGYKYYFAVVAYDSSFKESDFSAECVYRVPLILTQTPVFTIVSVGTRPPGTFITNRLGHPVELPTTFTNWALTSVVLNAPAPPTPWTLQYSSNLSDWVTYATGTGTVHANFVIRPDRPVEFFRLSF